MWATLLSPKPMEFSLFSWGYFKYTISFQIMEAYFLGKKKKNYEYGVFFLPHPRVQTHHNESN